MASTQDKMERARFHRDELGAQIAGFLDADAEVPSILRRRWEVAQETLDAAKDAVRQECREERWRINWEDYFSGMDS